MKNLLKKSVLKTFVTLFILLISQASVWAQSTTSNDNNDPISGFKVVLFLALLLVVLIAPAFKRSHHNRVGRIYK